MTAPIGYVTARDLGDGHLEWWEGSAGSTVLRPTASQAAAERDRLGSNAESWPVYALVPAETLGQSAEDQGLPLSALFDNQPSTPGAAPRQLTVELPEPDDVDAVEDDEGRRGSVPSWSLNSHVYLSDDVQAWPDGVDFDGDLTDSVTALRQLEQDALKVLAAIATHRRAARRG